MTARKQVVATSTIVPNALPTLRCLYVWISSKGEVCSLDEAIVGWAIADGHALPITPTRCPAQSTMTVIRDDATKTWSHDGRQFSDWKSLVAPLYARHDAEQAARGKPSPAIGGLASDPDHWGTGAEPARRPASGPRAAAKPHPREQVDE